MKRDDILLPLCLGLLFLASCGKDLPETEEGRSAAGEVTIVLTLPGDDFPEEEDLALRDAVAAAISEGGYGEILRTEGGMGFMEIGVRLAEGTDVAPIKRILLEKDPGMRYRIEHGEK